METYWLDIMGSYLLQNIWLITSGYPQGWANVQWPEFNAWMRENAFDEDKTAMENTDELGN